MTTPKIDFKNNQNITVNGKWLAKCFDVSLRTIQLWAEEGKLQKISEDSYPLYESLMFYIRKLKKELEESAADSPLIRAKIETQNLINAERQLKIKREMAKLVPRKMSEVYLTNVIRLIMNRMESLPFEINQNISGDDKSLTKIQSCINDARGDIAKQEEASYLTWWNQFEASEDSDINITEETEKK